MQLGVSAHIAAVVPFILGAGEVGTGSMVCDVLWLLFGGYKMRQAVWQLSLADSGRLSIYRLPAVCHQGAELYIPSTVLDSHKHNDKMVSYPRRNRGTLNLNPTPNDLYGVLRPEDES